MVFYWVLAHGEVFVVPYISVGCCPSLGWVCIFGFVLGASLGIKMVLVDWFLARGDGVADVLFVMITCA